MVNPNLTPSRLCNSAIDGFSGIKTASALFRKHAGQNL